ncbi:EAL domain-containing protein [Parvularcula dongshanensis]|uniref:EAL domain-containing protein (Putative c-di-GMP-specific phosphodiesterase class I) n=1 Tax=Parvularcula dongshanensis TaxID=1173995 RepID=A0A840I2T1_9PROT|nr:EAL domain-containing protein [Parvularcula dongshanensis]MBB4658498.1 EAL domain-containing protein (putative c-di-GMP-specific phosphodiesterase class I) [Parvularcula dongshanensis]
MSGVGLDDLTARFQPIVQLGSGRIVGYEALARLRGETGTLLEADAFVPRLVGGHQGLALTERMIDFAARRIADRSRSLHFVSVNVPARVLDELPLVGMVEAILGRHRTPAGALVIEVTEDRIMAPGRAAAVMAGLRRAGARIAMDDFGAGHATLARLTQFQFDFAKTDKAFAQAPSSRAVRASLMRMTTIARRLGVPVIAEGVEDERTARAMRALGCQYGQGYLFGRPAP